MTVHTIPADHLDAARGGVLVVDGKPCPGSRTACPPLTRAMCRYGGNDHPPAEFVKLTEPCETCNGGGDEPIAKLTDTEYLTRRCPACDGSGRTILTVRWLRLCVDEFPDRCPDPKHCDGFYRPNTSFRAHVLNVVPIVAFGTEITGPCLEVSSGGFSYLWQKNDRYRPDDPSSHEFVWSGVRGEESSSRDDLPPGEHVGRYAVLIEPEES